MFPLFTSYSLTFCLGIFLGLVGLNIYFSDQGNNDASMVASIECSGSDLLKELSGFR